MKKTSEVQSLQTWSPAKCGPSAFPKPVLDDPDASHSAQECTSHRETSAAVRRRKKCVDKASFAKVGHFEAEPGTQAQPLQHKHVDRWESVGSRLWGRKLRSQRLGRPQTISRPHITLNPKPKKHGIWSMLIATGLGTAKDTSSSSTLGV